MGFLCGSAGKESACNAGDLGSTPGLGRSPGERKGYPLQYAGLENSMDGGAWWAYSPWDCQELDSTERLHFLLGSLVAQMEKHLPLTRETWVWSLGQEDPLENEMATHSSTLAGQFHGWRSLVGYSPWGHKELDMTEWLHWFKDLAGLPRYTTLKGITWTNHVKNMVGLEGMVIEKQDWPGMWP